MVLNLELDDAAAQMHCVLGMGLPPLVVFPHINQNGVRLRQRRRDFRDGNFPGARPGIGSEFEKFFDVACVNWISVCGGQLGNWRSEMFQIELVAFDRDVVEQPRRQVALGG